MTFRDFEEFFASLNAQRVRYLIIGGYAVGFHARPRATKDIDVLVDRTTANARRVRAAGRELLGSDAPNVTEAKLMNPRTLVVLGVAPIHIDIHDSSGCSARPRLERLLRSAMTRAAVPLGHDSSGKTLVAPAFERVRFRTMRASILAPIVLAAGLVGACGISDPGVFSESPAGGTGGGDGGESSTSSSGADGGSGNATTTGVAQGGSGNATSTASSGPSSSSSGSMPVCGNGTCEPGEENVCIQDCPPSSCAHPVCEVGDPLVQGCDPCVDMVCGQDPYCCNDSWDGQCVQQADSVCGAGCCGDGVCSGESCTTCEADCGACSCGNGLCDGEDCMSCPQDCNQCFPPADCPHSVCGMNEPLDPAVCQDPCVEEVCAMDPTCCRYPNWTGDCAQAALMLCGPDPCITAVCAQDPTCCSDQWDQGCVQLATMLCNTTCQCDHSICDTGGPLDPGCNPCAQQLCAADDYCCSAGWDGICVGEVALVCGIECG